MFRIAMVVLATSPHPTIAKTSTQQRYALTRGVANTARVEEIRINNYCTLPVIFHEAGDQRVEVGSTAVYRRGVNIALTNRISLMFEGPYINEKLAVVELNGLFANGIGNLSSRSNINFIAQWGFVDMPLQVALWADTARTRLACRDGWARCTYSAKDCATFTDGSAKYEEHGSVGVEYGFCRSLFGQSLANPRACMGQYATYINDHCEVYDRDKGAWSKSARSVGYQSMGWKHAKFWDGQVIASTVTGRQNNDQAVNFECWEMPCIQTKRACISSEQGSVGNSGFGITCDADANGTVTVASLEITACTPRKISMEPVKIYQTSKEL